MMNYGETQLLGTNIVHKKTFYREQLILIVQNSAADAITKTGQIGIKT